MKCSTCNREMVQLFLTQVCDFCDYGPAPETCHRGFVVWPREAALEPKETYVFRARMDAERWQTASGKTDDTHQIREIRSLTAFRWHLSRGTLRDVVFADHMFEIFPDHRYTPGDHRAFLVPNRDA